MTDNGTPEPTAPDTIVLVHGYGAASVAIDSVLAEGVRVTPVSQIRSLFPILKNPTATRRWGSPPSSSTTPSPTP